MNNAIYLLLEKKKNYFKNLIYGVIDPCFDFVQFAHFLYISLNIKYI